MHGYLIKLNQRLDKSFFFITGGIKGRRSEWVALSESPKSRSIFVCMLGSGVRLLGYTRDKATVRKAGQHEDMRSLFQEKTLNTHAFNNWVVWDCSAPSDATFHATRVQVGIYWLSRVPNIEDMVAWMSLFERSVVCWLLSTTELLYWLENWYGSARWGCRGGGVKRRWKNREIPRRRQMAPGYKVSINYISSILISSSFFFPRVFTFHSMTLLPWKWSFF